jgi:hypothetical protein
VGEHPLGGGVGERRPGGQLPGERQRRVVEALVRQDAVDDLPPLQRRGVVAVAGHHELLGAPHARTGGEPLRAAHGRGQADDLLHEPDTLAV